MTILRKGGFNRNLSTYSIYLIVSDISLPPLVPRCYVSSKKETQLENSMKFTTGSYATDLMKFNAGSYATDLPKPDNFLQKNLNQHKQNLEGKKSRMP